jgi:hypothetical protein
VIHCEFFPNKTRRKKELVEKIMDVYIYRIQQTEKKMEYTLHTYLLIEPDFGTNLNNLNNSVYGLPHTLLDLPFTSFCISSIFPTLYTLFLHSSV